MKDTQAYKKLFPSAPKNPTFAEMWKNIRTLGKDRLHGVEE